MLRPQATLLYGLIWLLSLLPFWLLYRLSDLAFLVLRYLLRYRIRIVRDNLQRCFPEASEQQIRRWEVAYYRHLCDLMVESLKTASLSQAAISRRMRLVGQDQTAYLAAHKPGGIVIASHYGNFEWTSLRMGLWFREQGVPTAGIYARLSKGAYGQVLTRIRSRWGMRMIPRQGALSQSLRLMQQGYMIGFMTDQAPPAHGPVLWQEFLDVPTKWLPAAAKIALRHGGPVFYTDVRRVGRGWYELEIIPLPLPPGDPRGPNNIQALTKAYVDLIARRVKQDPPYWLWSHRRWK